MLRRALLTLNILGVLLCATLWALSFLHVIPHMPAGIVWASDSRIKDAAESFCKMDARYGSTVRMLVKQGWSAVLLDHGSVSISYARVVPPGQSPQPFEKRLFGFGVTRTLPKQVTTSPIFFWVGARNFHYSWIFDAPLLAPLVLCAAYPMWILVIFLRTRRRMLDGLCTVCGYDIRESPERCPECGNGPVYQRLTAGHRQTVLKPTR